MTAVVYSSARFSAQNTSGGPLVGGKLFTYQNGTTILTTTYSDSSGTENTNPVVLNGRGEAVVYVNPMQVYTFVLRDSVGALVWSQDGVAGTTSSVDFSSFKTELEGPSGGQLVGFVQPYGTSILRTILVKARESRSVGDEGDITPGIDNSPAFQNVADLCDIGQKRYLYAPNFEENYSLETTITFTNPGVRIFGDQGGSYNRGTGKKGWIETSASPAFDLGNRRTTGNPADHWQVDGISIKQKAGIPARSLDGISFTSRTNGPDRGALIKSASFIGLRDAITIENPDVSVNLASLDIQSCVFQGCMSAINAKGRIFGLRFVGNQCEQNIGTDGVIHGSVDGPITIDDNMLEGQPNPISIDIPPTFGNAPKFTSKGNYFEANGGDYVYRFRCTAPGHFSVGPNYTQSITATNYVLIQGSLSSIFLDVYDNFPVTFDASSVTVKWGSDILRNRQRGYKVRKIPASKPAEVIIADFAALTDDLGDHVHALPTTGTLTGVPFGRSQLTVTGLNFLNIPMAVAVGDLIELNVLCRARSTGGTNMVPQIYDQTTTVVVSEWGSSGMADELNGKWALVSITTIAKAAATILRFRMSATTGYDTAIAGIAAKNHGTYANDGVVTKLIAPVTPNFVP